MMICIMLHTYWTPLVLLFGRAGVGYRLEALLINPLEEALFKF